MSTKRGTVRDGLSQLASGNAESKQETVSKQEQDLNQLLTGLSSILEVTRIAKQRLAHIDDRLYGPVAESAKASADKPMREGMIGVLFDHIDMLNDEMSAIYDVLARLEKL